jgi:hypothetical protein
MCPLTRTSPSGAIRIVPPGIGWPTVPIFWTSGVLLLVAGLVSVRP